MKKTSPFIAVLDPLIQLLFAGNAERVYTRQERPYWNARSVVRATTL
jgi:hypothetical protein